MSEPKEQRLNLAFIKADKRLQFRALGVDSGHVEQLVTAIKEGAKPEKMVVFFANGQHYLVDGFHRLAAYREIGVKEVEVVIHEGTWTEAVWYAATANLKHGYALPLTNDSKVKILVEMKAPGAPWADWSLSKVAAELGVRSHNTVSTWLKQLVSSGKLPAGVLENKIVVTKAGKTIDTSKIGGSRATPEQAKHAEQQQLSAGRGGSQWAEPYTTPAGEVQHPLGEDAAAIRLQSKIKTAVKMGWLDADQADLHQFEELSPQADNYRLRNKVTGEIIDPHSRPADVILTEQRVVAAAERKVAQESADNSEALNVAILRENAVALPLLKLLETQGISACLDLPKDRRFKLMDDLRKGMMRLAHFYTQLAAADDVSATVAEMSLFTLEKMRGEMLQGVREKYGVDVPPGGSSSDAEMITMPVEGRGGKPYQLTVSHAGDADHSFELKVAWGHELAFYNSVLLTESQAIDIGNWLDQQIPDYDAEIEREMAGV